MTETAPRKSLGLPLAIGVAAVTGGLWLLLNSMDVGVPPFKDLWPILLVFAGRTMRAYREYRWRLRAGEFADPP